MSDNLTKEEAEIFNSALDAFLESIDGQLSDYKKQKLEDVKIDIEEETETETNQTEEE